MDICRLCLKPVSSECSKQHKGIDVYDTDMESGEPISSLLKSIVPEVYLGLSDSPVICSLCHQALKEAYIFRVNCLRIEKLIEIYIHESRSTSATVALSDVVNYYVNKRSEMDVAKANLAEWYRLEHVDFANRTQSENITPYNLNGIGPAIQQGEQKTVLVGEGMSEALQITGSSVNVIDNSMSGQSVIKAEPQASRGTTDEMRCELDVDLDIKYEPLDPPEVVEEDASKLVENLPVKCEDAMRRRRKNSTRVDHKAAERNRLYRERHREEINQRRRAMRQRKKTSEQTQSDVQIISEIEEQITNTTLNNQLSSNSHTQIPIQTVSDIQESSEIELLTETISNNQSSSGSYAQRQQRYYEKHKEELKKRERNRERNRNYRERHKQIINERRRLSRRLQQNLNHKHTQYNINNIDE